MKPSERIKELLLDKIRRYKASSEYPLTDEMRIWFMTDVIVDYLDEQHAQSPKTEYGGEAWSLGLGLNVSSGSIGGLVILNTVQQSLFVVGARKQSSTLTTTSGLWTGLEARLLKFEAVHGSRFS